MSFPYYQGDGKKRYTTDQPISLPRSPRTKLLEPDNYIADEGLRDACNVALLLNQPLLLTGEPGTGKTQFASSLAWELGFAPPLKFETKSNSVAKDLFYTYDALKRFQDIQSKEVLTKPLSTEPLNYLKYQALGLAILQSNSFEAIQDVLPKDFPTFKKQRSIVLIDEIDKAPRDFPNDLLNELDQIYFRIPELGNIKIEVDPDLQPIVIITSNSEKDLPDAFLRRCAYYNLVFPKPKKLGEIIEKRLGMQLGDRNQFLDDALDLFYLLRRSGLRKNPATAELLGWLSSLKIIAPNIRNPLKNGDLIYKTLSSLIKTAEDQGKAREVVKQWLKDKNR